MACSGRGLLIKYPWILSHFRLRKYCSCSRDSTPSAITSSPIRWPIITMELASERLSGALGTSSIKVLSTFRVVIGRTLR
ncbi:hypothetical protein D3C76_1713570 [compost metagenome]